MDVLLGSNEVIQLSETIGPNGRIGIMVPMRNVAMEDEFKRMAPEGVSIHTSRMGFPLVPRKKFTVERLIKLAEDTENATGKIAAAKVNVICYGCTSGSFVQGLGEEKNLVRRMEKASMGIPAITTTGAVLDALRELKMKKLSVGTPYPEDCNEKLKEVLKDSGFEIISFKGLWPRLPEVILRVETSHNLAKEIYRPEADGIFISCTNFRTIENIERLERETGKPVVTSNQASMWASLRKIGYEKPIKGYGQLLRRL